MSTLRHLYKNENNAAGIARSEIATKNKNRKKTQISIILFAFSTRIRVGHTRIAKSVNRLEIGIKTGRRPVPHWTRIGNNATNRQKNGTLFENSYTLGVFQVRF